MILRRFARLTATWSVAAGCLARLLQPVAAAPLADPPPATDKWLPGYAIRYLVRIQDTDAALLERQTVQVALPTGGWLQPDAADIRVVDARHGVVPAVVISHDPRGDTLLQFARRGTNRWYWVYAVNPQAGPQVDAATIARMAQAREASRQETLKTMKLRTESAQAAGDLRDTQAQLTREQETLARVDKEIGQVPGWIAERNREWAEATAAVTPLQARVTAARTAFSEADQQAKAAVAVVAAAVEPTAREAAEATALPLRMALAGAKTKLEAEEKVLASAQKKVSQARARMQQGEKQLADAHALKQKTQAAITGLTSRVETLRRQVGPLAAAVTAGAGRAEKLEDEYRRLALDADPRLHREGLAVEVRDWGGDQLDELNDWPTVVAGLQRSDNVLGNALITDVLQKMNPFRLGDTLNFAASYRGFLDVKKAGLHRFVLNADDAAFLFINDYLVFSRVGSNQPLQARLGVFSVGADIELGEGVYPLEIHQVTGNTPGAVGRCAFYWITPGAKTWARVPSSAFCPALMALPVRAEAPDGSRIPIPSMGIANSLNVGGADLFLARFEADGAAPRRQPAWEFGDGQRGVGTVVEHLYFAPGDYEVKLQAHPDLPPFKRRLHVWPAPVPTSPLALGDAVRALGQVDLDEFDAPRLALCFALLRQCGQPDRWPLMERVAVRLLRGPLQDLQYRIQVMTALMEALARQGRSSDALAVGAQALAAAEPVRALTIAVQVELAMIHYRQLQDFDTAAKIYAAVVDEHRRLGLDDVRDAAIAWGDMYLAMGDISRAASTYRLADSLGRPAGQLASVADLSRRGGLLRTAEKLLRDGSIRQSRQILERIEQEYPEQKVEGLFRFLRAEADRHAGFYAESIMHYEVLLRMPQWAGHHPQAMAGLADAHYRLDQFDESLKWLDVIRESDAPFYEDRKLKAFRDVAADTRQASRDGRLARARLDRTIAFDQAAFTGEPPVLLLGTPACSTNALTFGRLTTPHPSFTMTFDVPQLISESAYWIEFWFRNETTDSHATPIPQIEIRWAGSSTPSQSVAVIRTFGLDFMGAARLQAPMASQGAITLTFVNWQGVQQIHGLRLRPVTARREEALLNFWEGRDTP